MSKRTTPRDRTVTSRGLSTVEIEAPTTKRDLRAARWLSSVGQNVREFAGLSGTSLLWPRWLVLRAIGLVYVIIFAGVIVEAPAILGPQGLAPASDLFPQLAASHTGGWSAFIKAPTLFWISSGALAQNVVAWAGLVAALALVLNLWPRFALFGCWAGFLSFVAVWGEFSPAQLDALMLETALVCIPFAPAGVRPGLGEHSPPRPLTIFVVRWLLLRVMFESGLAKLVSTDPSWRNFTAMDSMYETSPLPTVLGYWLHQAPHAWHAFEVALMFAAELIAPLLAALAGRPGRWAAFILWTAFQLGIALTANFGWLNAASLALGVLLLDDTMLGETWRRFRPTSRFAPRIERPAPVSPRWSTYALRSALSLYLVLTLYYFGVAAGLRPEACPRILTRFAEAVGSFNSVNRYTLYARVHPVHVQIEFEGSNDGGRSWRTFEFRHLPHDLDRAPRFIAPWFPRIENTLLFEGERSPQPSVITTMATQLLRQNPVVTARFRRNPFPDSPPTVVRMRRYRYGFTTVPTLRRTRHFWRKEDAGDYLAPLYLTATGDVAHFDLTAADDAMRRGNLSAAMTEYEQQYRRGYAEAGFRLADIFARHELQPAHPAKMFALLSELAESGEVRALHRLGLCHEHGAGVAADPQLAVGYYRRAADRGYVLSMVSLGALAARQSLSSEENSIAFSYLLTAARRVTGDDPAARYIRRETVAPLEVLRSRLKPDEIAAAEREARSRR